MAVDKAIDIHEHFAATLKAERRLEAAAKRAKGETEAIPERSLGLRAFVATGERINTTRKIVKSVLGEVKRWYSASGSTVGRSSVGEQPFTDATSTGK